jgi:hypothetical protein
MKRKRQLAEERFVSDILATGAQGCQMVNFQTKITKLGKFWRALEWNRLVYSMAIWNLLWFFWYILSPFGNLVAIVYIFPRFGILCQEKSGNPAGDR